jgi:hypothetical protein
MNCGAKKPQPANVGTWDCSCGAKGITGNFCTMCGSRRPVENINWDCSCGQRDISGNFCPNCGKRRGE